MKSRKRSFFCLLLIVFFLVHNFLPYLGLRFESCQTMFSNLRFSPSGNLNNHLVIGQFKLSDLGTYLNLVELKIIWRSPPSAIERQKELFLRNSRWVNTEALHWILSSLCSRVEFISASVTLDLLRYQKINNLCGDSSYLTPHWWIPIQLYPPNDSYELKVIEPTSKKGNL